MNNIENKLMYFIKMISGFNNYSMLEGSMAIASFFGVIFGHIF